MNQLINDFNRGFSLKNDDLRFVDAAVRLALSDAIKGFGVTNNLILWGCAITVVGTTASVAEGAIYHDNEIWHVDAHTFTVPDPLVTSPLWVFVGSYDAAGAKTDIDLVAHNTYQLRKAVGNMSGSITGAISSADMDGFTRLSEADLSIGTLALELGVSSDHITYVPVSVKQGHLAQLEAGFTASISGSTKIAEIPSGYRPKRPIIGLCRGTSSGSGDVVIIYSFDDSGDVYIELLVSSADTGPYQLMIHSPAYRVLD